MTYACQSLDSSLSPHAIEQAVQSAIDPNVYRHKRVLLIVPDNTRSGPIGACFKSVYDHLGAVVSALDVLVALGTHRPLDQADICRRLDITPHDLESTYRHVGFFNHEWDRPEMLKKVGVIRRDQMRTIYDDDFVRDIPVSINRRLFDYDCFLIIGPVFPHEVVGFSGGHKYLFPGIAGPDIIDFFHWLGARITNPIVNGNKWSPTRQVVEKAASFIDLPHELIALVALKDQLKGIFIGSCLEAWERAADLSAQVHIRHVAKPLHTVVGIAPAMYEDLWTAGKVMYKLEPVVADGGRLIIYAPHIQEVSYSHGDILRTIGYHTRDYFLANWETYQHYPHGVIAHSTHVKGAGRYIDGKEEPRIQVVLATGLSERSCREINLGYSDPENICLDAHRYSQEQGTLLVPDAGEILYRLSGNLCEKSE